MQADIAVAAQAVEDQEVIRIAPEPATPRALWPTFMRRTLAEETVREAPARPRYPANS